MNKDFDKIYGKDLRREKCYKKHGTTIKRGTEILEQWRCKKNGKRKWRSKTFVYYYVLLPLNRSCRWDKKHKEEIESNERKP